MKIKYPIELEITSFCSLQCISCIHPSITSKHHVSEHDFDVMLDYVFENRENILYLNLSGVWDIFLHPEIEKLLLKIVKKFSGTGLNILISSKGTILKENALKILSKYKKYNIYLNVSVGIYSLDKDKYEAFTKVENSFEKVMKFLLFLKKYEIPFSLEMLMSQYSVWSIHKFQALCQAFWVAPVLYRAHNFWGRIAFETWRVDGENLKENCDFDETQREENSFYTSFSHCHFIPFFSSDGKVSLCSLSSHGGEIYDFSYVREVFPNYIDLVFDCKSKISFQKCGSCSLYRQ